MSSVTKTTVHRNHCTFFFEDDTYEYIWTIKSFSKFIAHLKRQVGRKVSSTFPNNSSSSRKYWTLSFSVNPVESSNDSWDCTLYVENSSHISLSAIKHVKLNILDINYQQIGIRELKQHIYSTQHERFEFNRVCDLNYLLEKAKSVPPEDTLIIKCNIRTELLKSKTSPPSVQQVYRQVDSTCNLETLRQAHKLGDVTFVVNHCSFPASKGLLAARSSVFAAMFQHQMEETLQNRVTISDITPKVFEELLRYIHDNEVVNLETLAFDLFAAADKYDIAPLKALCQDCILTNLSVATATKALTLADLHSADEMKDRVLQFIRTCSVAVTATDGWKILCSHHPHLVGEIVSALSDQMKQ